MNNFIDVNILQYSLESLANKIKLKLNEGGHELPIGTIVEYAGVTAPFGYRICDGSALLVADHPELFDVIGYTYGGADDVFHLPNFQGKSPIGYNMNDTDFDALGKAGGEKAHTLSLGEMYMHDHIFNATHSHTFTGKSHSHSINSSYAGSSNYFLTSPSSWESDGGSNVEGSGDKYPKQDGNQTISSTTTSHTHSCASTTATGTVEEESVVGFTNYSGESRPHNNLGPYLVVNYIIKVMGDESTGLEETVVGLLEGKANVDHKHEEYITEHQDISHLATKEEISNIDLSGYATESFVTNKIAEAQLGGDGEGAIDLSGYATKDDLVNYATKDDLIDYVTEDDLNGYVTEDDLSGYATKIDLIDYATEEDFIGYATEEYVDAEISSLVGSSPESLNTLEKINEALAANDGALEVLLELLSGKADLEAVKTMVSPIGSITQFAGTLAPTDYMICDGSSLAKADYPDLFNVIGYAYGGEGSMFNLPNLQGRVAVGYNADHAMFDTMGATGGEETHIMTREEMYMHDHIFNATHSHTFTGTAHNHTIVSNYAGSSNYFLTSSSTWETDGGDNVSGSGDSYPKQDGGSSIYSTTTSHGHSCGNTTATGTVEEESIVGFTNYTGESRPHNNMQPYVVMNYIIKVK